MKHVLKLVPLMMLVVTVESANAQTIVVPNGLLLRDSNGLTVGRMAESELVALKIGTRIVFLGVTRDRLWNPKFDNRLVFDQPGCTGTAYHTNPGSLALVAMIGPGERLYLAQVNASPVDIVAKSEFRRSSPGVEGCGNVDQPYSGAVPATKSVNISGFAPPFRVVEESSTAGSGMDIAGMTAMTLALLVLMATRKGSAASAVLTHSRKA